MIKNPLIPKVLPDYCEPAGFPNCCPFHTYVMDCAITFYKALPSTIDNQLLQSPDFNIINYTYDESPENLVHRVSFTEHHIESKTNELDWLGDIKDYIEYIIWSLGSPAFGADLYINAILLYIDNSHEKIDSWKAQILTEWLERLLEPSTAKYASDTDLNELYSVYKNWLDIFPFEIAPLRRLKEAFHKTLPLLKEKGINRYDEEMVWVRFKTKKELIEWLNEKTKITLIAAGSKKLIDSGLIKDARDAQEHQYQLFSKACEVESYKLLCEFSEDETSFCETIHEWLKIQERFFNGYLERGFDQLLTKETTIPDIDLAATVQEENNFNSMPLDDVRKWFMQLATNKATNNKPYLSLKQVDDFIKRAFIGNKDIPKLSFNMEGGDRMNIQYLFFLYGNYCKNILGIEPTRGCKEKYVKLLTDNFTNYDYKTVFGAFHKPASIRWSKAL